MNRFSYLNLLDDSLLDGLNGVSLNFIESQTAFVASRQQPDGGFRGRQGDSDLYYTDFGLRCSTLLGSAKSRKGEAPNRNPIERIIGYIQNLPAAPSSIVEIFSFLNIRRMLEYRGDCLGGETAIDKPSLKNQLFQFLSPTGGFARHAGELRVSAYDTFLGGLCLQMLGEKFPRIEDAVRAVEALKQPDGGYAEIAGQPASQTAATAAATAFLTMHEAIAPERSAETVDFLFSLQSDDGGLKPHGSVETGDLLSTFTGLVALAAFDALGRLDAGRLANFLRQTAIPTGGFLACPNDAEADLEYTYYGIGVLAMLRTLGH